MLCTLSAQNTDSSKVYTFKNLEEALENPDKVKSLDLSNQEIDFNSVSLSKFKNLEYLSLKNDGLSEVPKEILEARKPSDS